jgi:4-hydroxybenzoate polyprenyltransferase
MTEQTQMLPARGQSPGTIAAQMWRKLLITLEMIKVEHSVFALPFALTGAMLAVQGWPSWRQVFWIVVAMVGARSAAMTFNRIADREFDARNPRTEKRALPAGHLTLRFAVAFTVASSALLVLAAWELNPLAFKLSPAALALLLLYSYTKRFTLLSHIVLGMCLGLSPVAAWIALRGDVSWAAIILGAAVTLWVAGFDIIYACQDVAFDRAAGLHSVPKRFGIAVALYASAALHVMMLALLVIVARMSGLGWIAMAGLVAVAVLLAYEHLLVKPSDLSRVNAAFFTINGYISVLFFLTWAVAILVR